MAKSSTKHGGAGGGGAVKYHGSPIHVAGSLVPHPPAPAAQLTAAQQAQNALNAMHQQLAAAPPIAPTVQPSLAPAPGHTGSGIPKDTQVYSNLAAATQAAKDHVAAANSAKALAIAKSHTAAAAATPSVTKTALAQAHLATEKQLEHLANAKHAADQAVALGMPNGTEQHTPSTIDIKTTNAQQALAQIKANIVAHQANPNVPPTAPGATPAHTPAATPAHLAPTVLPPSAAAQVQHSPTTSQHTIKAHDVVGKVANTKLPFASLANADAATRLNLAQQAAPSTSFHTFDKHEGTAMTAAEQAAHLAQNTALVNSMKDQLTTLTAQEKAAVHKYTGDFSGPVNTYLYEQDQGHSHPSGHGGYSVSTVEAGIKNITKAINKTALPVDTMLYRGIHWPSQWNGMKAGDIVNHVNFGSASTHNSTSFSGNIKLEIEAPAGTKAIFAQPISQVGGEREVLLQRGYKFLILKQTKVGSKEIWRVRVIQD